MNGDKVGPNLREWNGSTVTWREYVDLRFADFQRAVDKAENTMNERLAGMNEFRDTLRDQAGKFVTRDELDLIVKPVRESLKIMEINRANLEGKASQNGLLLSYLIAGLGLILSAISIAVRFVK
jgi:hypothetical protein